jgi:hypothetical protein
MEIHCKTNQQRGRKSIPHAFRVSDEGCESIGCNDYRMLTDLLFNVIFKNILYTFQVKFFNI